MRNQENFEEWTLSITTKSSTGGLLPSPRMWHLVLPGAALGSRLPFDFLSGKNISDQGSSVEARAAAAPTLKSSTHGSFSQHLALPLDYLLCFCFLAPFRVESFSPLFFSVLISYCPLFDVRNTRGQYMVGAHSTSVCGSFYAAFPFSSMSNHFSAGCCWDTEVPER